MPYPRGKGDSNQNAFLGGVMDIIWKHIVHCSQDHKKNMSVECFTIY